MNFKEKHDLRVNDDINGITYNSIEGLLVGNKCVATLYDNDYHGHTTTKIYPAWFEGRRAWLFEFDYSPIPGQGGCSSLTEEVREFSDGVNVLLNSGAFKHMWAKVGGVS